MEYQKISSLNPRKGLLAWGPAVIILAVCVLMAPAAFGQAQKYKPDKPNPRVGGPSNIGGPNNMGRPSNIGGPNNMGRPGPGGKAVIKRLPHGHVPLRHGHNHYFYHRGHFYRRGAVGFVTIFPPVGLVIPLLPPGYTTVVVGGIPYYYFDGVYYNQSPNGFVVVVPPSTVIQQPPTVVTPEAPFGTVSVIASALNVRGGPGRDFNIITVIRRGGVYPVQATSPGWLYIELPDGRHGWVEKVYTVPASTVPSG